MYAITGITGKIGSAVAEGLLSLNLPVRAVMRDPGKAEKWAARGCEIAIADLSDADALARAFSKTDGVFILPPPNFDPQPGFPEIRQLAAALSTALTAARLGKVVSVSTIGAQANQVNLLSQHTILEGTLGKLSLPITFLRPAWFMENAAWDVAPARDTGCLPSFLQPLDKPVPMVATIDISEIAASLLQENWTGKRIVELEGPRRITPNEIAATFTKILGRPVYAEAVPRESWGALFTAQGMNDPMPRIQMLDGFNEGWIGFEGTDDQVLKGKTEFETVLRNLVAQAG